MSNPLKRLSGAILCLPKISSAGAAGSRGHYFNTESLNIHDSIHE